MYARISMQLNLVPWLYLVFTSGQMDNNVAVIDISTEYFQEEMLGLVWQGAEQARQKKGWE